MVDDPNKLSENDSFMDEDDFLAADREEVEGTRTEKPNLKQIWSENPSLKIFALVAGVVIILIGFLAFSGGEDKKPDEDSVVRKTADVTQAPGTAELPPAIEEATRADNEQRASDAEQTGGSSIPTMIQRPSERIEAPVQAEETDPLSAWRREAETRRLERQQENTDQNSTLKTPTLPPATPAQASADAAAPSGGVNAGTAVAVTPPPPLPTGPTPEMVQAMATQLQQQMQTAMETQVPKESVLVSMNLQPGYNMQKYFPPENQAALGQTNTAATQGTASSIVSPPVKPLVSAGTIVYAQILTEANSDVPGPVLAEVASGPLSGGRAIGTFAVAQRHLVLQFNRVVKNGVEYSVNGIALDPATTLPGVITSIDYHLFSRVVLPAAASFIQGFAQAATQQNTDTVITNGTVITNNTQDLNTREELLQGVNEGAQSVSDFIDDFTDRPITLRVAGGTRIGILFTSAVYDPATQRGQQSQYPDQAQSAGLQGGQNTIYGAAIQQGNASQQYTTQQNAQQNQQYAQSAGGGSANNTSALPFSASNRASNNNNSGSNTRGTSIYNAGSNNR